MDESLSEFELIEKINELRSYIASDWPGIEERKHMYQRLAGMEIMLRDIRENKKVEE